MDEKTMGLIFELLMVWAGVLGIMVALTIELWASRNEPQPVLSPQEQKERRLMGVLLVLAGLNFIVEFGALALADYGLIDGNALVQVYAWAALALFPLTFWQLYKVFWRSKGAR